VHSKLHGRGLIRYAFPLEEQTAALAAAPIQKPPNNRQWEQVAFVSQRKDQISSLVTFNNESSY
jgi:hypothetical protein